MICGATRSQSALQIGVLKVLNGVAVAWLLFETTTVVEFQTG